MLGANDRVRADYVDICGLAVDTIVNPAHRDLLGGGGLDGMIHEAAGPELLEACRKLNGCEVGDARTAPGFMLPALWVIHTVGPIWHGGHESEDELLGSCYRRCLEEGRRVEAQSIAFTGISTGLHRFPVDRAAAIAVEEVRRFLERSEVPRSVIFACFDNSSLRAYDQLLGER